MNERTRISVHVIGLCLSFLIVTACRSSDLSGYEQVSSRIELRSTDPAIASELFLVKSYGDHRVRLERVCNPAHCTTIGFLERLDGEFPRSVAISVEIAELTEKCWAFVHDVRIVEEAVPYAFDLFAVDTHGTEERFTLRLTPGPEGNYEAEFRDVVTIAEPDL